MKIFFNVGACLPLIVALSGPVSAAKVPVTPVPPAAAADPWQRSYTLEAAGKYAEAAKELKPLLKKKSPDEFTWLRYGWLLYMTKNFNEAITAYEKAIRTNPASIESRLGLALPLMAQLRWNETAKVLDQVLKSDPWNYTAHAKLLYIESLQKDWKSLEKRSDEVASRYPSAIDVLSYQAYAKDRLGKTAEAAAVYRQILERSPGHAQATAYLLAHH